MVDRIECAHVDATAQDVAQLHEHFVLCQRVDLREVTQAANTAAAQFASSNTTGHGVCGIARPLRVLRERAQQRCVAAGEAAECRFSRGDDSRGRLECCFSRADGSRRPTTTWRGRRDVLIIIMLDLCEHNPITAVQIGEMCCAE